MYQLAKRQFHASYTHGNAPNVDILVCSEKGDISLSIQVKTTEYATRHRGRGVDRKAAKLDFHLGRKGGLLNEPKVLFAFVDLNTQPEKEEITVYLIPSTWLYKYCKPWIDGARMVRFQPRIEEVEEFRNAWGQVSKVVGDPSKNMDVEVEPIEMETDLND